MATTQQRSAKSKAMDFDKLYTEMQETASAASAAPAAPAASVAPAPAASATGFDIVRSAKRARVTPVTEPTIMSMSGKFAVKPEMLEAQTNFFNRNNQEKAYEKVSPWNFPFVQALLQRTPLPNFDMDTFDQVGRFRDSIEGVTRKYEESFLTEPVGDQRRCVNDESCEGLKICKTNGFVLREFLLPSQLALYNETQRYPVNREPCLMCKRFRILRVVVATRADGNGLREDYLVQDYYNYVDLEEEYRLEDCILSKKNTWEGLCNPVVLHQRNNYRFAVVNQRKTYTQWRYPFFRLPPGEIPGNTSPSLK